MMSMRFFFFFFWSSCLIGEKDTENTGAIMWCYSNNKVHKKGTRSTCGRVRADLQEENTSIIYHLMICDTLSSLRNRKGSGVVGVGGSREGLVIWLPREKEEHWCGGPICHSPSKVRLPRHRCCLLLRYLIDFFFLSCWQGQG